MCILNYKKIYQQIIYIIDDELKQVYNINKLAKNIQKRNVKFQIATQKNERQFGKIINRKCTKLNIFIIHNQVINEYIKKKLKFYIIIHQIILTIEW